MLLDRGATANCKPELEIFADDVKCAHGATVGELDAMQLFYAAIARARSGERRGRCCSKASSWACGTRSTATPTASPSARARRCGRGRMNIADPSSTPRSTVRDQFPAIAGWHYLDSAATAQKPQAVIDAITRAYGHDYATVHRGVYERSAAMTAELEERARRAPR